MFWSNTKYKNQLKFVLLLVLLLSLIEVVNIIFNRGLNVFGTYPRELFGLRGIIFSHFLHGDISHFASNIFTLGLFSFLMLQYGSKRFALVSVFLMLSIGILVWLLARPAMHLGASGMIYGYLGFLLLGGLLSGRVKLVFISLIVAFFYGGLVFGVLPTRQFVSWESHLFGFVCGLLAANFWARSAKPARTPIF